MPPRPTWKGFLQLSLVSVPVQGFTATSSAGSPIRLNQLHAECHERIRYQKVCPVHGEVSANEIVMGYEYARGQYVVVDPDELDRLRTEKDKSISIDAFVPSDSIDPLYFSGKTYYLVPDGTHARKPYSLLHSGMTKEQLCGVAQVVVSRREQLVLIRPLDQLLAMSVLIYPSELRQPESFRDQVPSAEGSSAEVRLTRTLLQGLTRSDLDLAEYRDLYDDRLRQLVEAKAEGRELVAPDQTTPPPVINLMDALKASVEEVKPRRSGRSPAKSSAARRISEQRTKRVRQSLQRKKRKSG